MYRVKFIDAKEHYQRVPKNERYHIHLGYGVILKFSTQKNAYDYGVKLGKFYREIYAYLCLINESLYRFEITSLHTKKISEKTFTDYQELNMHIKNKLALLDYQKNEIFAGYELDKKVSNLVYMIEDKLNYLKRYHGASFSAQAKIIERILIIREELFNTSGKENDLKNLNLTII
ncbi:hypothetical protein [Riemerella columbipharyngis]|uniref:Uncharacterized protein n=1 Tax=Riemerella columbipharyngis TaxID=1071918 RepID=A0A1G6ZHH1_9FLAO|nr:hypothetical protein [Riemerella columbipharyngis]SDE00905.1 hypothetical protein SAMN05421544_10253 [Riemerella columbipharyngis]SDE01225.1 hypothetical protein SAMN05421544_10263 [Riemerella columbipharyngis]